VYVLGCFYCGVQLLEQADCLFKYYVANTYMTNIPLLCLLLYGVIMSEASSTANRMISVFHCCYTAFQMMAVSVTAIIVSTQVRGFIIVELTFRVRVIGNSTV